MAVILLLPGAIAFGQRRASQRPTATSTANAPAIDQDTTLRRVDFTKAMLVPSPADKPSALIQSMVSCKYTALYTQQGDLQQLIVAREAPFSPSTVRYYFVQNEVVYIENVYVNATRMGSCGQITFHNYYFLNQQRLVSAHINQQPNTGFYASCYPVIPAAELAQLLQELTLMLNSLKASHPPKP